MTMTTGKNNAELLKALTDNLRERNDITGLQLLQRLEAHTLAAPVAEVYQAPPREKNNAELAVE
jgi:hypothetical protein